MRNRNSKRLSNFPAYDVKSFSTYKPKDVRAYELRKKKKALRLRLELEGRTDKEIKAILAETFS
jgi:hypothetical protein